MPGPPARSRSSAAGAPPPPCPGYVRMWLPHRRDVVRMAAGVSEAALSVRNALGPPIHYGAGDEIGAKRQRLGLVGYLARPFPSAPSGPQSTQKRRDKLLRTLVAPSAGRSYWG